MVKEKNIFKKNSLKMILAGIYAAAVLSSLTGCLTYQGQLDTSVPMKEQIALVIHRPLNLADVDGENVAINLLGWSPFGSSRMLLPVGEHSLYFDYKSMFTTTDAEYSYLHQVTGGGSLVYNFEPDYVYHAYSDSGEGVYITRSPKPQSGAAVAFETGYLAGLGKGPVNLIGLNIGASPFGMIVDTGKISFGPETYLGMNAGYAPDRFIIDPLGETDNPLPIAMELYAGAMFNVFFNRNKGHAIGLGVDGGHVWELFSLFKKDVPKGVYYLRGAFIPIRSMKLSLYFDYYLTGLLPDSPKTNAASWGVGLLGKVY